MSQPTAQIKFRCKSCGKQFSVHTKLGGRDARCPCGAVLKIPMPEPDAIDLTSCEVELPPIPKMSKRKPGKVANTVAALGIVIIVALTAYAIQNASRGSQFDLVMLVAVFAGLIVALAALVLLLVLPGLIAQSRNHSKAEAIKVCGYASLILWPLWPVALVWAFTEKNPAAVNPHAVNAMFAPKRDK